MEIAITNFGNHDSSHIVIPDKGITLFVGENGSGKSMVGEAITWCLWGETIRTTRRGWSPASPGASVSLLLGDRIYDRKLNKGGGRFTIDGKGTTRDNNTEVERLFGPSKLYLTTRVFHRSLLVRFSNATDSERKAIIEYLLGASEFDVWYRAVKEEHSTLGPVFLKLTRKVAKLHSQIAYYKGQLEGISAPQKPVRNDEVKAAEAFLREYKPIELPRAEVAQRLEEKARIARGEAKWERQQVKRDIEKYTALIERGKCPVCGADTEKQLKNQLAELVTRFKEVDKIYKALNEAYEEKRASYAKLVDKRAHLRREADDLEKKKVLAEYVIENHRKAQAEYKRLKLEHKWTVREATLAVEKLKKEKRTLMTRVVSLESRLRRLDDLMKIYGPRGARVDMLREAFEVLGEVATDVARRLYKQRVEVEIRPSENLEQFTLRVTIPDGRDISYRGLSEGERSLVDFSLLKALAAVPRFSTGAERLPLCYDDLLDAIDDGNRGRVLSFVRDEARSQGVIIFSHDESLLDMITEAISCYRVAEGKVVKV